MAQGLTNTGEEIIKETILKGKHNVILDQVTLRERTVIIDVPKVNYVPVEYEKPIIRETVTETIRFVEVQQATIKYIPKEETTIKYIPEEVKCEKPIINEVTYERPVIKEVVYEKPIIETKKITVVDVVDIENIKLLTVAVKQLSEAIPLLISQIKGVVNYKLVEQVITVPKIEWTVVKAERIEWIPVKREMPNADSHN